MLPPPVPRTPIGFRLAHELEGLLLGITADGVIMRDEVVRIESWLAANQPYVKIHPFSELASRLEHALADKRIDSEEVEDLLFVTRKLTTVNPYFDQIRGGVQQLMGVLAGVSADRSLSEVEARELDNWLDCWSHLKGIWPYDECEALVTSMLAKNRVGEEAAYIVALSEQFPVAGHCASDDLAPALLVGGVCAIEPVIEFVDRRFVFTGECVRMSREGLEELPVRLGGSCGRSVTRDTHYLIVCDGGSPHWAFSCYGRKVEKAYEMRRHGHAIQIVHENDFWDAVADRGIAT